MKNLLLLIVIMQLFSFCNGQTNETYWKSENVTKIDNKPFRGVTLAYMDMVAEMRFHLSKKRDSLIFTYPYQKKIKISELKSLTNCRIPSTGELLDSIYDVQLENDMLKIKFHYLGTDEEENRFSLNLVKIKKEEYLTVVKDLETLQKTILDKISNINLSDLELVKKPEYLSEERMLLLLNPIQLAEELVDNKNALLITTRTFSLSKEKNKINYKDSGIENTNTINKNVAQINDIDFSNIEFINEEKTNQTNAVIVSKKKMGNDEITKLYNYITKTTRTNTIEQFGLPKLYAEGDSLGIHSFIAITWKTKDKIIKLTIDNIPKELWDKEIDSNVALTDNYTSKDIDLVFRHYLKLIEKSDVKLFIVSSELHNILHLKENSQGSRSWGNIYDYVFKWRYLHEIWENE